MGQRWTAADIPDQTGRVAVVTGANSGIGEVAAQELARAGAQVVLACRDTAKGDAAADRIRAQVPDAALEVSALDLADLASVEAFVSTFSGAHDGLDLLVNNAGIMAPPRRLTPDGFESQIGTNHLGHFALTGRLVPLLLARPGARVVTVSSEAHKIGTIALDDLHGERRYSRWGAYGQSKLANLLFSLELDRRGGDRLKAVSAHPGYSATNLQFAAPPWHERLLMRIGNLAAQSAAMGALPTLYAAVEDVPGNAFVGPGGLGGMRGHPQLVAPAGKALDADVAAGLWGRSVELTGVDPGAQL